MSSIRLLFIFSFIVLIIFALQGILDGVITNNAPLTAPHFPIHHNNARLTPNRIALSVKVNSSKNSNNGPSHLSIQHQNTPHALITLKNDNLILEKEYSSEHETTIPQKEEIEKEVSIEEIKDALHGAIINKIPLSKMSGKYSKHFEEVATMILNDLPTATNLEKFPNFGEKILENGSKTVIKLSEFENILKNHKEFFERAIGLDKEEEKLIKFKMAGNELKKEKIKEKLNKIIFEGTNEEKLMKEILDVLNIKETEQSLIGTIYKQKIELNNCYNFLLNFFLMIMMLLVMMKLKKEGK
uniref:DUF148 domain-containing protein n=1 Tax=Meloidogyne hapla TaxID=6305 RepID=A0A1I8B4Y6_MELHA